MEFPGFQIEIIHAEKIRTVVDTVAEEYFKEFKGLTDKQKDLILKMVMLSSDERARVEDAARKLFNQQGDNRG